MPSGTLMDFMEEKPAGPFARVQKPILTCVQTLGDAMVAGCFTLVVANAMNGSRKLYWEENYSE